MVVTSIATQPDPSQEALEPAVFAEAFASGQQMSLEQGIATLLIANAHFEALYGSMGRSET